MATGRSLIFQGRKYGTVKTAFGKAQINRAQNCIKQSSKNP